jgi:topoisomerase-4 subunit A
VIYKEGSYELTNYELINRFEPNEVYHIQKFFADLPIQCVHYDGKGKHYFVKRFLIETATQNKKFQFISEEKGSKLIELALAEPMLIELKTENKKKEVSSEELNITEFIEIKGWKAIGNRLTADKVKKIKLLSEKYGEPEVIEEEKLEVKPSSDDPNSGSTNTEPEKLDKPDTTEPKQSGDNPQMGLF